MSGERVERGTETEPAMDRDKVSDDRSIAAALQCGRTRLSETE